MIDCLLIGYNETSFEEDVKRMKAMGTGSISYKDFSLGYIYHDDKPFRAMDILTYLHYEDREGEKKVFHNADVLWQVIMYLGTYLNKSGLSFDYVNLFHLEKDKLREKLEKEDIMAIAITTTIYVSVHPILEVISFIRKYNKTVKIIVGGPYISKQSEEVDLKTNQSIFKLIGADFYIISLEGEATLAKLLKEMKYGKNYHEVDNIAYKAGEDYIFSPMSKENNSLEENMIDYTLFPKMEIRETVNIRTSKSCPFSCAYCGFPLRAEKYTYTSVERVEKELNILRDLGTVKFINFIDDTFNIPKSRFKDILKMMIRNKYEFKWYSFYRCDFGDEEIIQLMKKAGCIGVFLGVESANDKMLERMNKTSRLKDYLKAIPLLKQAGITLFVSTIIGFPGETYETFKETVDLIEETKPDFFRPQIWWSDPLTPVWKKRDEYGIKGLGFNWSHNTMDSKTAYDLFEKAFLSIENSIWVPDPGFNAYGMYYLMQRGMTIEQVKTFLKCFNAVVKEKILNPGKTRISPDLFECLMRSCNYDKEKKPDMNVVDIYSGSSYKEAEAYWINEYKDMMSTNKYHKAPQTKDLLGRCTQYIAHIDSFQDNSDITEIILAAYSILISRIHAQEDISIIAVGKGKSVFPMVLRPKGDLEIKDYLNEVERKIKSGLKYHAFAFNILSTESRMQVGSSKRQYFNFAYNESEFGESKMKELLKYYPDIYSEIGLFLNVSKEEKKYKLVFDYKRDLFDEVLVSKFAGYIETIIHTAGNQNSIKIRDITVTNEGENNIVKAFKEEDFIF